MPRGFSYSASLLTAIILALIPAAIVPDLIVPIHDTLDLRSPVRKKNDAERFPKYIQREMTVSSGSRIRRVSQAESSQGIEQNTQEKKHQTASSMKRGRPSRRTTSHSNIYAVQSRYGSSV